MIMYSEPVINVEKNTVRVMQDNNDQLTVHYPLNNMPTC